MFTVLRKITLFKTTELDTKCWKTLLCYITRWDCNSNYVYRVIKERQYRQTIQFLRCSSTDEVLVDAADILGEAGGFYQKLYTSDDADAIHLLQVNIPSGVKISSDDATWLSACLDNDPFTLMVYIYSGLFNDCVLKFKKVQKTVTTNMKPKAGRPGTTPKTLTKTLTSTKTTAQLFMVFRKILTGSSIKALCPSHIKALSKEKEVSKFSIILS